MSKLLATSMSICIYLQRRNGVFAHRHVRLVCRHVCTHLHFQCVVQIWKSRVPVLLSQQQHLRLLRHSGLQQRRRIHLSWHRAVAQRGVVAPAVAPRPAPTCHLGLPALLISSAYSMTQAARLSGATICANAAHMLDRGPRTNAIASS